MKLTNLKIETQLKIGFAVLLLFVVMLGVISHRMNDQIHDQTETIYNHPFQVRKALGSLEADILSMRLGTRDLMLAKTDEEKQDAVQMMEVAAADALRQFDELYGQYLGPKSDVDDAFAAFTKWKIAREENSRLALSGDIEKVKESVASTGTVGIYRDQMLAKIKIIDDYAKNKAVSLYASSTQLKDTLNTQLLLLVAAILVLSVLLNYFLLRNIRKPLEALIGATRRFHAGELDARSSYESKNEFGVLSASFNSLAESIQVKSDLAEKVASLARLMLSEYDVKKFFQATLNAIANYTGSQMAAIYLLSDDKKSFEHFESTGVDNNARQLFASDQFEGEFGAVLSSRKIQHLKNIPADTRFVFHTVSGKFIPNEIITLPILANNEIVAIISMASISRYSMQSLQLIDSILVTLCARVEGILAFHKIEEFLKQMEQKNTELEVQEEELHILNRELASRSETLAVANSELIAQKRELSAQASELNEQNVELEMQKRQLVESNRLKTSFLSNMSHELRTPLNSVIALSGVLNRRLAGKVAEEEYSYLDVIERNGKQLLSLINDILDLSRIESGREEVEINRFNPRELINEVVELIDPQANQKNISLCYLDGNELPLIKSDYKKCRHILQNLVANAVKFTEQGGVEISAEVLDESVQITVSDTGIGIDQEQIPHIFDEFRQADGSSSRKYGGTGLGLAIAKKYTEMLGGNIGVESIRHKGSKFAFNLPFEFIAVQANIENYADHLRSSHPTFIGETNTKDKTILLVEDTEAVIIQMKDMLVQQGYNIMVARNGNEALEQIEHQMPDAMILDLMMPEVDGFEVLKRIRSQEKTDHLPVIILTAKYVTKEELAFLKHNSVLQLIQKGDINKDQLLAAVARMLFPETVKVETLTKKPARIPVSGTPLVLIVEDNPDNMLTIKALLDGKCKIIEAEEGKTGVEQAIKHHPHLILMDIALPGMNGIEALNEIRKVQTLEIVPIIAVSASAMKGDREDFIALGFDDYISKPIDNRAFQKMLTEYLN